MNLTIQENHIVTLTYELRDTNANGELLERMDARYPFIFLFGNGKLLPAFEEQLRGLGSDDAFEFTLSPEEAYGKSNALNILNIKIENFKRASDIPDHYIEAGNMVNLTDDDGLVLNGKILEVTNHHVKVDFNHSMVDKTLHFKGAVLAIRPASTEELIKGHYLTSEDANWR